MVSFALGAALLSMVLSVGTYTLARRNFLHQRERDTIQRAYLDAQNVQRQLTTQAANADQLGKALQSVATGSGTYPVIQIPNPDGDLVDQSTNPQFGLDAIPARLTADVQRGNPSLMRASIDGQTMLVVGLPLPTLSADGAIGEYYEIVSLQDISQTLNTLANVLLITMIGTTLLGIALGWWVSRGVLRPLGAIGLAAEAIASGRLGTRLEETSDPDLERIVDTFNHMAANLETRIEQDARFTSDVSHELRSPITTLTASMGVLEARRDDIPEGPARAAVDLMSADLQRFQQLVEDLLEISRYDAGAIRLELSEIRITELVKAVLAGQHLDVPVYVDPKLENATIRVDKRRLSRVIANLLDNAVKYGEGPTRMEITEVDERVRIAVEDGGAGVSQADREVIFDRFSRGSAAGRRSSGSAGVGLGLALVSEHLRLQGGRVWVENRPDKKPGARFVVELDGSARVGRSDEAAVT
jgi:signal transduction histidine kinase